MPIVEDGEESSSSRKKQHLSGGSSRSSSTSSSSESLFSDDASTSMPAPPDGGYGWMIVFAAFMINLISDGISFSFGILYTELLGYFSESKSLTSWVGSLFYGVCLIGGPLASALATKFGCRVVLMGGGIVAAFGTFVSAFATDIQTLIVTFGIVSGFGMSMGYVTSVVMVAFYFEDKRALATGLAVCGSGIGTFVFAPLTEHLIDIYGWRGTMIIWSGIILNLVVFGALLRPLEFSPQERRVRALLKFERMSRTMSFSSLTQTKNASRIGSRAESVDSNISELAEDPALLCHSQIQIPTFLSDKNIPVNILKQAVKNKQILKDYIASQEIDVPLDMDPEHESVETKSETSVRIENGTTEVKIANGHSNKVCKPKTSCLKKSPTKPGNTTGKTLERSISKHVRMSTYLPLYKKGLFFRGNLTRVNGTIGETRSTSCPELSRSRWNRSDSESSDDDEWDFMWHTLRFSKQMRRVIKTMFDPSILLHPLYVVFAISNFILYFWYDIPYIFMADRAIELGMSQDNASYLISVLGIVNTFGQIIYGIIGDRDVDLSLVYGISCMVAGCTLVVVPLFTAFVPLAVLSGLFGFFISANYSLSSVILVEYLGLDKLSNAYGLMMLVQGVANLIGPPVAAALYDHSETYDLTFFCGGGLIMFSGLMLLGVPFGEKLRDYRRRQHRRRVLMRANSLDIYDKRLATPGQMEMGLTEQDVDHVANQNNTPASTLLVPQVNGVNGKNVYTL